MTDEKNKTGKVFWSGMAIFVLGVLFFCGAFMFIMITERALLLWMNADKYIPTEAEVVQLIPDTGVNGQPLVTMRIDATDEEILTPAVPSDLHVFDGPKDMIGSLMTPEEAKGKRFPVWYSAKAKGIFSDLRIAYSGEFEPAAAARNAMVVVIAQLLLALMGCLLVVKGYRRARGFQKSSKS